MKPNIYEAQKRYTEKNLNNNQKRVNVWVRDEHVKELKRIAARMRSGQWKGGTF